MVDIKSEPLDGWSTERRGGRKVGQGVPLVSVSIVSGAAIVKLSRTKAHLIAWPVRGQGLTWPMTQHLG